MDPFDDWVADEDECWLCGRLKEDCDAHCHEDPMGHHQPDVYISHAGPGNGLVFDVTCINCGKSGSFILNPSDILWE